MALGVSKSTDPSQRHAPPPQLPAAGRIPKGGVIQDHGRMGRSVPSPRSSSCLGGSQSHRLLHPDKAKRQWRRHPAQSHLRVSNHWKQAWRCALSLQNVDWRVLGPASNRNTEEGRMRGRQWSMANGRRVHLNNGDVEDARLGRKSKAAPIRMGGQARKRRKHGANNLARFGSSPTDVGCIIPRINTCPYHQP